MELKYLFSATFTDGSTFDQPSHDTSELDPEKSAFFDVLNSGKEVETFSLVGCGHAFLVDLRDGHFEVDGRVVFLGSNDPPRQNLRLIFFRQHSHDFVANADGLVLDSDGKPIEMAHRVRYCIGWQATVDGRNVQEILGVF